LESVPPGADSDFPSKFFAFRYFYRDPVPRLSVLDPFAAIDGGGGGVLTRRINQAAFTAAA
jgi:hypothetical protein